MSCSGDYISIGDSSGIIYLYSKSSERINFENEPLEISSPFVPISSLEPSAPFNLIGMPLYQEPLLSSNFPGDSSVCRPGLPPVEIPSVIVDNIKTIDFIGYSPNLTGKPRYLSRVKTGGRLALPKEEQGPKFRSEKLKIANRSVTAQEGLEGNTFSNMEFDIIYRKPEIKYSRFGIEDFDFSYFNQTNRSGLESDIPNSYANALLQVFLYSPMASICLDHCERGDINISTGEWVECARGIYTLFYIRCLSCL
jgi:PAB-dependent poly(A)-specific ribonuclease subunit 2